MFGIAARTIWQPACSNATAWRTLPVISSAGAFNIDCTLMGAVPPIAKFPAYTVLQFRRFMEYRLHFIFFILAQILSEKKCPGEKS